MHRLPVVGLIASRLVHSGSCVETLGGVVGDNRVGDTYRQKM